jgi:hypothetical protein
MGRRLPLSPAALLMAGVLAAALPARAAEPGAPPRAEGMTTSIEARPVRALHYGDTLFNFFQQKHFSAITGLMTSQYFERVAPQGDEAEVLRGGLLLSYGVHNEAAQIFAALIDKGAAPSVRDRAWFYLAKIRYQRGLHVEAEAALARIEGRLPAALAEERDLLQAQLLMARGDFAGAANLLGAMTGDAKQASPFARFNLGVALIKGGEVARGTALLEEIGRAPADSEELRSLRDRANLALGVAALRDERPDDASRLLERVRLSGLYANKALLGFGWVATARKQPAQALVAWNELASRDGSDPAVLEARIAVPYAHAQMGAYGPSLRFYEQAVDEFDNEERRLDASIAAIRSGHMIDGLLERNPAAEMGWFGSLTRLPEMPHAAHLSQVLAEHEFQEAFKNVRDLRFLERNLQQWRDTLDVFRDMLANRRQAFNERLPKVLAQLRDSALVELSVRGALLAGELNVVESESDSAAFANPAERDLLARLASVQAILQQSGDGPEFDAVRDRARLAAGVLSWQLAEAYPQRLWTAKNGLRQTDNALDDARLKEGGLTQAQRDEPARFQGFAARIDALSRQLDTALVRVVALKNEQQGVAQQIAEAALIGQKQRLLAYTTQARFEIAQLIDRATVARSNDSAPR